MVDDEYNVPRVWSWEKQTEGEFSQINRPIAGATHEKVLPTGVHPLQLYSLATPNGVKVTILLEELLALGFKEAEYDAHLIRINEGDQFSSGFVEINPNSKIPALVDRSGPKPIRVFESGSILLYLAEKHDCFIPESQLARVQCMNWLFWQMGSAPILGGGFGHFYNYAPQKLQYPIDRFSMEVKRQLDVLDQHLEANEYMAGADYSIADMAIYPWYGALAEGTLYGAAEFLSAHEYVHVLRWAKLVSGRDAVRRGRRVNKVWGPAEQQVPERHSAADLLLNR